MPCFNGRLFKQTIEYMSQPWLFEQKLTAAVNVLLFADGSGERIISKYVGLLCMTY